MDSGDRAGGTILPRAHHSRTCAVPFGLAAAGGAARWLFNAGERGGVVGLQGSTKPKQVALLSNA